MAAASCAPETARRTLAACRAPALALALDPPTLPPSKTGALTTYDALPRGGEGEREGERAAGARRALMLSRLPPRLALPPSSPTPLARARLANACADRDCAWPGGLRRL